MSEGITKLKIGLVMPIAAIDGCGPEHWAEIKSIIADSMSNIDGYECETKIVSEGDSIGLIHKRIVEGLYNSDIIICDVSCKNPNVMFELGMRLAFDKPTVIIKDDKTNYSFDTAVIEHLEYPRDLRFTKMVGFKAELAKRVIATFEDAQQDPDHSTFLKSFGQFKVATFNQTEMPVDKVMFDMLSEIQSDLNLLKRQQTSFKQNDYNQQPITKKHIYDINRIITTIFGEHVNSDNISTDKINDLIKMVREVYPEMEPSTIKNAALKELDTRLHTF